LLAGLGAGWYDDAAEAAEHVVELGQRWTPGPEAVQRYRTAYTTFRSVHDELDPGWARWYS
jgi:sugar (pentulose or hexulose) kinase